MIQQEQARQDSLSLVAEQRQKEEKQRNMWLIIGGVVLAVLGFVGNQSFQHIRNSRNQRNLMEMQNSMVKRAENEAKRRAESMVRNKTRQAIGNVKRKGRDAINEQINKATKGKNRGFSI